MDILERYLGYEAWTLRHILGRCRDVSPEQLHHAFDAGHGTLHETITHVIGNLEVWTDLLRERPVRDLPPIPADVAGYLQRFEPAMEDFVGCARRLAAENRLDDTYMDVLDNPPAAKTFGGTILHQLTHTTVHRWEMQHMLQRLGVADLIEGDALSWEKRLHSGEL
jgi:uncharacterized damage-inducible protein DinB